MRSRILITLLAPVLLLTVTSLNHAQEPAPATGSEDQIEQLRLTPEQRQRIRMIFEENKAERQGTNRRVREANVALDQALDADAVDTNVVEQRLNELTAAQAAQLRMRIETEMKIRRELRPEQLATLRRLRLQIRDVMGGGGRLPNQRPVRDALRPNQRNGAPAVFPHRNIRQP